MAENSSGNAHTGRLCRDHELLLPQGEDLSAHHSCNARPANETKDRTQRVNTKTRIYLIIIHDRTDDDIQRHRRNTDHDIDHAHQDRIDPSAEVTGTSAHDHTEYDLNDDNDKTDHQRNPAAVHQAGQHIHTVSVRAKPVRTGRRMIRVVYRCFFLNTDHILLIFSLKLVRHLTGAIFYRKAVRLLFDRLLHRLFKFQRQERAGYLRRYDQAGHCRNKCSIFRNLRRSAFEKIQIIGLSIFCE